MSESTARPPLRPIIGLTSYRQPTAWGAWDRDAAFVPATYVDVVSRAGGQPVLIPPLDHGVSGGPGGSPSDGAVAFSDVCRALDGVVLVGGGDLDPRCYGQDPDPRTIGTSPARDELELGVLEGALERGIPVLAVCRGLQLLNVAFGGDLVQH
ncbi:MAG: gamma-glutamyl-gamma-aminobutyrate hydrolase family protein, partial [Acidimicrobiales bacterium]|nr:gamma-glutamyl-gamma-aminobutyrate hydrolase family protein [Acidimicrobiales bacterium]